MSNSNIVAAVTSLLRQMLFEHGLAKFGLSEADITAKPPDLAHNNANSTNQVNLFLYHLAPSAAWRSMELPGKNKPGETSPPPLALNLNYLLTVYSPNDNQSSQFSILSSSQQLLGEAMRVLHDHPVIITREIREKLDVGDVGEQIENIRISPLPLSLDELTKLWTTFQVPYRTSIAYQVSVVLIESRRPSRTPLPVLSRGPRDEGFEAQAGLDAPTLRELKLPPFQSAVQLDQPLGLIGSNLAGEKVQARFRHPRAEEHRESVQEKDTGLEVIPTGAAWLAGWYTVAVIVSRKYGPSGELRDFSSNELPFALAPKISTPEVRLESVTDAEGNSHRKVTISLTCNPPIARGQRISFLLGGQEIVLPPPTATLAQPSLTLMDPEPDQFLLRLRVDGADSLLEVDTDPKSETYRQYLGPKVTIP